MIFYTFIKDQMEVYVANLHHYMVIYFSETVWNFPSPNVLAMRFPWCRSTLCLWCSQDRGLLISKVVTGGFSWQRILIQRLQFERGIQIYMHIPLFANNLCFFPSPKLVSRSLLQDLYINIGNHGSLDVLMLWCTRLTRPSLSKTQMETFPKPNLLPNLCRSHLIQFSRKKNC